MIGANFVIVTMVLTVMAYLVGSAPAPLSKMKHITLHVESEVLEGHRIVITLEPLDKDTLNLPDVSLQSPKEGENQRRGNGKLPEGRTRLAGRGKSSTGNKESDKSDSTTPKKEEEEELTATTTTEVPTNSTDASSSSSTESNDTKAIINVVGQADSDPDVYEFIVTIPDLQCPEGFRPDPNGKCREVFSATYNGKSMESYNFLPSTGMKPYGRKFNKKFMMG